VRHLTVIAPVRARKTPEEYAWLEAGTTKRGGCAQIIHSGAVHRPRDRRIMSPACWRIPTVVPTCVNARLITATSGDLAAYLPWSWS